MRKVIVQTDYDKVLEVKATWNEAEANMLLATGKWTMLHGSVAHQDNMGFQAKPCWLLGRVKK